MYHHLPNLKPILADPKYRGKELTVTMLKEFKSGTLILPVKVYNATKYCGEEGSRLLFTQLKQGALLTGNLTGSTYIFDKYDRAEDRFSIWGYATSYRKWMRQSYGGYDCPMFRISKYIDINKLELKTMVEAL